MVLRGHLGSSSVTCSLRPASLTIGLDERLVAAWDRAGRLYSLWKDGATCRRGLNGQVLAKRPDGSGPVPVDPASADDAVNEAAALARRVLEAMGAGLWRWRETPDAAVLADLTGTLADAAGFTAAAARADAGRFAEIYSPIGVLPPDQYLALVLQATDGCAFNTCTFCDLYHRRFRIKRPAEFREHIAQVRAFLGKSMSLRSRSIFLGSANALAIPMTELVPLFEDAARVFETRSLGISSFLDAFSGASKTADDYRALASFGLRRVYVGLESGHDPLLEFVHKPGTSDDALDTVRALKSAGVHVGVIVMVGLGGDRFAARHTVDTAAVLTAMGLGPGDLVYFSELIEPPRALYPRVAADRGIRPLHAPEMALQRQAIRDLLVFDGPPPQLATYDVREFIY